VGSRHGQPCLVQGPLPARISPSCRDIRESQRDAEKREVNRLLIDGSRAVLDNHLFLISHSVQSRLDCHHGISFTEFSYQLLQAYDFYKLYKQEGCTVQVGGSDQWGNIVAGVELIAHLDDPAARSEDAPKGYGLTTPLLVNSQGLKMGKSEGNAMWLDPLMTSPFEFFQVKDSYIYPNSKLKYPTVPVLSENIRRGRRQVLEDVHFALSGSDRRRG
jgi:tyrosyl-tRNA synthetase